MSIKAPVTYNDIIAFIREIGIDSPCPTCNTNQWSLEGADQNEGVQLFIAKRFNLAPPASGHGSMTSGISCYALLCNKCGYAKIYGKYAVQLWKEQKNVQDVE